MEVIAGEREAKIAAIERHYDGLLRPHACAFTGRRAALRAAIASAPELFQRPRTFVFAGIKVGYQKQKGKILIPDEPGAIAKMIRLLGDDEAAHYLNVVTTINKTSVNSMPAGIMKKLGIEITADTDAIVVKLEASALEKQIAALMAPQADLASQ